MKRILGGEGGVVVLILAVIGAIAVVGWLVHRL